MRTKNYQSHIISKELLISSSLIYQQYFGLNQNGTQKNKKNQQKAIVNPNPHPKQHEHTKQCKHDHPHKENKQLKDKNKDEQMKKIMDAINNLDLDKQDFIDTESFNQSKAILENALQDLQHYLTMFEKEDYDKFPKPKPEIQTSEQKQIPAAS